MKRSSGSALPPTDDQIEQLTSAIDRLADEVRVLRDGLDEFHEDFRWAARNGQGCGHVPVLWTSVPADPRAPDWADDVRDEYPSSQGVF